MLAAVMMPVVDEGSQQQDQAGLGDRALPVRALSSIRVCAAYSTSMYAGCCDSRSY